MSKIKCAVVVAMFGAACGPIDTDESPLESCVQD